MKLTKKKLKSLNPCTDGYEFYLKCNTTDLKMFIKELMKIGRFDWANWLLPRLMTHKQKIMYAVFAAKQVLPIFEQEYPKNKIPRLAIEAAEKCIKHNTVKNRKIAASAANAASAASAASAAFAGYAAFAASAGYAAFAASAGYAASADRKEMQTKVINNGLKILNVKSEIS